MILALSIAAGAVVFSGVYLVMARDLLRTVVGVSLEAEATLRFRRRRPGGFDRFALPAPPRPRWRPCQDRRRTGR